MKRKKRKYTKRAVKPRLVFITAFQVSGAQFYTRTFSLSEEMIISLQAVDNNAHDPFAIAVRCPSEGNKQIGWYPRVQEGPGYESRTAGSLQQALHRMIKGGVALRCHISTYQRGDAPTVSVYLETPE